MWACSGLESKITIVFVGIDGFCDIIGSCIISVTAEALASFGFSEFCVFCGTSTDNDTIIATPIQSNRKKIMVYYRLQTNKINGLPSSRPHRQSKCMNLSLPPIVECIPFWGMKHIVLV